MTNFIQLCILEKIWQGLLSWMRFLEKNSFSPSMLRLFMQDCIQYYQRFQEQGLSWWEINYCLGEAQEQVWTCIYPFYNQIRQAVLRFMSKLRPRSWSLDHWVGILFLKAWWYGIKHFQNQLMIHLLNN
jgi:hypothetical protein